MNRYNLEYMTSNKWIDGILLMLDYGLDPNSMISTRESLLDWSIKYKYNDLLKKLLLLGADINSDLNGSGSNSFFSALQYLNEDVLTYIVKEADVDLSMKNKKEQSIISFLITKGDITKIKLLIDLGADIRSRGINNLNLWELLSRYWGDSSLDIANLLWKKGLTFDFENNLALHHAAEYQVYEYVKWLLEHGIDPNIEDDEGDKADIYAYTLVDYYNPEEEAMGITYEDVKNKAKKIVMLIRSYQ